MTEETLQETLSPADARELIASGGASALDIRDDEAWEAGRIPGAGHHTEEAVLERLEDFPEDKPIVVVCANGERSAKVAAKLRQEGRNAANVKGGMDAWRDDDLPMQPRADEEYEGPDYTDAGPGT